MVKIAKTYFNEKFIDLTYRKYVVDYRTIR